MCFSPFDFQTFRFSFGKPKKFPTLFFLPIRIVNCLKSISSPPGHFTLTGLGGSPLLVSSHLLDSPSPGPAGCRVICHSWAQGPLCFPSRVPGHIQPSARRPCRWLAPPPLPDFPPPLPTAQGLDEVGTLESREERASGHALAPWSPCTAKESLVLSCRADGTLS